MNLCWIICVQNKKHVNKYGNWQTVFSWLRQFSIHTRTECTGAFLLSTSSATLCDANSPSFVVPTLDFSEIYPHTIALILCVGTCTSTLYKCRIIWYNFSPLALNRIKNVIYSCTLYQGLYMRMCVYLLNYLFYLYIEEYRYWILFYLNARNARERNIFNLILSHRRDTKCIKNFMTFHTYLEKYEY